MHFLFLLSRLARYSQKHRLKEFLKSCASFLRKYHFSNLNDLNPGFGRPWDMLWIFFVNVIFLTLQKKSFSVKKSAILPKLPNPGFRSVREENWDFLKKNPQDFKKYFQSGFLWIHSGQKCFIREPVHGVKCLGMLQRVGMREGSHSHYLAFQNLILMIWRPCDLNLLMILY